MIYDESFAHLDSDSVQSLIELILKDDERTVVMTSHQVTPEIRERFHSLVLKDGTIHSEIA